MFDVKRTAILIMRHRVLLGAFLYMVKKRRFYQQDIIKHPNVKYDSQLSPFIRKLLKFELIKRGKSKISHNNFYLITKNGFDVKKEIDTF